MAQPCAGVYPSRCLDSADVSASFRPSGVLVPLVTPFAVGGAVDLGALRGLAEHALGAGAAGLVALATTGEPTSLDDGERAAVVAVCAEVCAQRGGSARRRRRHERHPHDHRRATRRSPTCPAWRRRWPSCPYYVRPSEAAIVRHFQAVAERSPVPADRLQHPLPHRPRPGRGRPDRAGRHRQHRGREAGRRQHRRRHAARARRRRARRSRCWAATTRSCSRSMLMGAAGAIAASANLCTAAVRRDDRVRPPRRRRGRARPCRGAAAARAGALRRAEPGGDQGAPARAGPHPHRRTCACRSPTPRRRPVSAGSPRYGAAER